MRKYALEIVNESGSVVRGVVVATALATVIVIARAVGIRREVLMSYGGIVSRNSSDWKQYGRVSLKDAGLERWRFGP